jgi:hypothetical protein
MRDAIFTYKSLDATYIDNGIAATPYHTRNSKSFPTSQDDDGRCSIVREESVQPSGDRRHAIAQRVESLDAAGTFRDVGDGLYQPKLLCETQDFPDVVIERAELLGLPKFHEALLPAILSIPTSEKIQSELDLLGWQ